MFVINNRMIYCMVGLLQCFAVQTHGSNGNMSRACFNVTAGETPHVNVTLSCGSSKITNIEEISYSRPLGRGDKVCSAGNDYSVTECCAFSSENAPLCTMYSATEDTAEQCQNATYCNVMYEAKYMKDCGKCDNAGDNNIRKSCWSRVVKVRYGCSKEDTEFCSSQTVSNCGNTEAQGDTDKDESSSGQLTDVVIALAVIIPISFSGGIAVTFLYFSCNSRDSKTQRRSSVYRISKAFEHEHRNDLYCDMDMSKGPLEETYCDAEPDDKSCKPATRMKEDHVVLSEDRKYHSSKTQPSYPDLSENVYYVGVEEQKEVMDGRHPGKPAAAGTDGEKDELTENPYYDRPAISQMPSQAEALAVSVTGTPEEKVELAENPYYESTMKVEDQLAENPYYEGGGDMKLPHNEKSQQTGDNDAKDTGNYMYTYGHFELEGRHREQN